MNISVEDDDDGCSEMVVLSTIESTIHRKIGDSRRSFGTALLVPINLPSPKVFLRRRFWCSFESRNVLRQTNLSPRFAGSSPNLKYLEICDCSDLIHMEVSAINLVPVKYIGAKIPIFLNDVPRLSEHYTGVDKLIRAMYGSGSSQRLKSISWTNCLLVLPRNTSSPADFDLARHLIQITPSLEKMIVQLKEDIANLSTAICM